MSYLLLYFFLYRLAAMVTVPLLLMALSHTDRVHMRERARRLGESIINSATSNVSSPNPLAQTIVFYLRLYVWRPICILTEIIGGFNEGIECLAPTMMIAEPYNAYRLETTIAMSGYNRLNPQPSIVSDTTGGDNRRSNLFQTQSTASSPLKRIDPNSHKTIAAEIIGDRTKETKNEVDDSSSSDDEDNQAVSISTHGDDLSDASNDSDHIETDEDSESASDSDDGYRRRRGRSRSRSSSRFRSRSRTPEPRRRGIRVKRVAPKSKNRGRIRLARRR
jgi:hypothetical protein